MIKMFFDALNVLQLSSLTINTAIGCDLVSLKLSGFHFIEQVTEVLAVHHSTGN